MSFDSLQFALFFPTVVLLYFLLPQRFRLFLLLPASYYFYMSWRPEYVVLIALSTATAYWTGSALDKTTDTAKRKSYVGISLVINLGILFSFKYFNFLNGSIRSFFQNLGFTYPIPDLKFLLPVGISFYTFQVLSYTIDVYRGHTRHEKNWGVLALYVSFFPQLVAGPIERSNRLLPQFFRNVSFDAARVSSGLRLMLWGFFKKILIADRLSVLVDQVYNNAGTYSGWPLIIATYAFAFQIYCDFSGYSDIAIGAARVLGFDLMTNFRQPYLSRSVREFWTRWHISLSTWFRDYVYIPLGGGRVGTAKLYRNLAVVFLLSGLWHGAAWTFLVWGALHAALIIGSQVTKPVRSRAGRILRLNKAPAISNALRVLVTFHLVTFAWIFFRANSLPDAFHVIRTAFSGLDEGITGNLGLDIVQLSIAAAAVVVMEIVQSLQAHGLLDRIRRNSPVAVRWAVYALVVLVLLNLRTPIRSPFIYFQF